MADSENVKELIAAVKGRTCLYDKSNPDYCNRKFTKMQWKKIAEEVGMNDFTARKRWRKLRQYFIRIHKQTLTGKFDKNRKTNWYLYDRMLFVLPYLSPRHTSIQISSDEDDNMDDDDDVTMACEPPIKISSSKKSPSTQDTKSKKKTSGTAISCKKDKKNAAISCKKEKSATAISCKKEKSATAISCKKEKSATAISCKKELDAIEKQKGSEIHTQHSATPCTQKVYQWTQPTEHEIEPETLRFRAEPTVGSQQQGQKMSEMLMLGIDEDEHFFKSLTPKMKMLNTIDRMECQAEIHKTVLKYIKKNAQY